jgi:alanine-glyoxylate transaminase/serine-glyoxylate transaminase/serine-pyruvate transaminase
MTLRHGREFLAIPCPTTVPDEVLQAMHRPAVEIYAGALADITASLHDDMRTVFRTKGRIYIYAANGHGAWEAAVTNVLSRGDTILVLKSGRFAAGWGQMAAKLGVAVETVEGDGRRAVDPAEVEDALRADTAGRIKAVLVVQVDTASGVVNDIPAMRAAIDAAGHGALLMVDTIASLATMPFEMDDWGVDVAVSASQKGLMMSPGLSFVAAGKKARAAHDKAGLIASYWDWSAREGELHYQKYCGTPPVHMLFGLQKALELLFDEGFDSVFRRHRVIADAVRAAVSVWAARGPLEFNILAPGHRADSVTTILTGDLDPAALLACCDTELGVVLGIGIGEYTGRAFRIAHMGHLNAPMILGTLGTVEAALAALAISHGPGGVQVAVAAIAAALPA